MQRSPIAQLGSSVANSSIGRSLCSYLTDKVVPGPHVLFFHGVEEELLDERIQVVQIRLAELRSLVDELQKRFCIIDMDEYCERAASGWKELDRCVMLTFDDGYESVHRLAAPFLSSRGITFTVYLTTSGIGTNARIPTFLARAAIYLTRQRSVRFDALGREYSLSTDASRAIAAAEIVGWLKSKSREDILSTVEVLKGLLSEEEWGEVKHRFQSDAFMSWEQAAALRESGVVIGAHGHEHIPLHAGLSEEHVTHQIETSTEMVRKFVGECNHFAYPNGTSEDIGELAVRTLKRLGYKTAVTTYGASIPRGCAPLLIPRFCNYDIKGFENRIIKSWLQRRSRELRKWQASLQGIS